MNEGFNELIHAPLRLRICAFLAPLDNAEFQIIRDTLDISDSVLSKHLKRLEEADYISQKKQPFNGRQRIWLSLTPAGRQAFQQHVAALKQLMANQSV